MRVRCSDTFKRGYKIWRRKNPDKEQLLIKAIDLFIQDQTHPHLRTHKLKGRFRECFAFAILYDLRIMFYLEDAEHAVFIGIGTHKQVY